MRGKKTGGRKPGSKNKAALAMEGLLQRRSGVMPNPARCRR
jgi:hypothetical protein